MMQYRWAALVKHICENVQFCPIPGWLDKDDGGTVAPYSGVSLASQNLTGIERDDQSRVNASSDFSGT